MKNKFNTLEEQMLRMKSLFTEERLYGNLIKEQDPNTPNNTEEGGGSKEEKKTVPKKPTGEDLKKQGYVDTLPDGENESDYDVKEDDGGNKWYKLKDEIRKKRDEAKKQNLYDQLMKKMTDEGWKLVDSNHTQDADNYDYKKETDPKTNKEITFYKPKEKGDLTRKQKRFGQCKKLLNKYVKEWDDILTSSEQQAFLQKIKAEDDKNQKLNNVGKIQYCIKTNGKKLAENPDYSSLLEKFKEMYGVDVSKRITNTEKSKDKKEKKTKNISIDSTTIAKPVRKTKNKFIIKGVKGANVADKMKDGKYTLNPILRTRVEDKLKQHMGLTGDIDLRVTSDKGAPRQVEIQILPK